MLRGATWVTIWGLAATPAVAAITGISGDRSVDQGGRYFVVIDGMSEGGERVGFTYLDAFATNGRQTTWTIQPSDGHLIELYAPDDPGTYDMAVQDADGQVIASYRVNVTEAWARLDAPDAAAPGEYVDIGFEGPAGFDDEIRIANFDDPVETSIGSAPAIDSPALLQMPTEEGKYEIRYVETLASGDLLLTFQPIEVDAQAAHEKQVEAAGGHVTLDMPAEVMSGAPLAIGTDGLDAGWWITLEHANGTPLEHGEVTAAVVANPLEMTAPSDPGEYHVVATDANDLERARYAITVVPAAATVEFLGITEGGSFARVAFTGPGGLSDKIGFALPGAAPGDMGLTATSGTIASPAQVMLPKQPGRYELRYDQYLEGGFRTLASVPVDIP